MWVLRFTHQPLYLRRKSFCIHSCSPFRDSIDAALKCKPGAAPASALRSHPTSNVICEMAINRCSLFWAVTQCMLIVVYRRFGRAYRPHFQRFTQYKKNHENRWKRVYVGRSVNCVTTQKMEDIHMATKVWDLAWILTVWGLNIHPYYLKTSVYLTEDSPFPLQRQFVELCLWSNAIYRQSQ